jgi:hypothetical protein
MARTDKGDRHSSNTRSPRRLAQLRACRAARHRVEALGVDAKIHLLHVQPPLHVDDFPPLGCHQVLHLVKVPVKLVK